MRMWNKQGKDQRIKKIEKRDVRWEKKETKMRGYRNNLKRTGSPVERIPEIMLFFPHFFCNKAYSSFFPVSTSHHKRKRHWW